MEKILKDSKIASETCPEGRNQTKLYDGNGLYLLIKSSGSKLWRYRYQFQGKGNEIALGKYPTVSLHDAREKADVQRKLVAAGKDPAVIRKSEKAAINLGDRTFGTVALNWWEQRKDKWSKDYAKKVKRWITKDCKILLPLNVNEIDEGHITELMISIESSGNIKKAPVVLSIVRRVFGRALALRFTKRNPAQGFPLMDVISPLPAVKSFAAILEPKSLGKLIFDIDTSESGTYCTVEALKLLPRVFLRPNELRNLRWDYVDFKEKLIRIPAETMKSKRDHLVPLSTQVILQLNELNKVTGYSPYIFPNSQNSDKPISKNVLTNRLKALGYSGDIMTAHGFRSTASTILNEKDWDDIVVEMQLAHLTGTVTSRTYNRAKYLSQRRAMMQYWADHLEELKSGYL